jgi:hypothetical protein
MILKTAPTVIYKSIKEVIGNPDDYAKNKQKDFFPDYNTKIPLPSNNEDDDLQAALDSMRISEFSQEEAKVIRNDQGFRYGRAETGRSDADMFMPVKALNQFSSDWRIKVRVTNKSEPKKWNNVRGTGELFSVDMVDADGT